MVYTPYTIPLILSRPTSAVLTKVCQPVGEIVGVLLLFGEKVPISPLPFLDLQDSEDEPPDHVDNLLGAALPISQRIEGLEAGQHAQGVDRVIESFFAWPALILA